MGFCGNRSCLSVEGCLVLNNEANNLVGNFDKQYKERARAAFIESQIAKCASDAQVLDNEGRNPGAPYIIPGKTVDQCPRIARIMFQVLDHQETKDATPQN